MNQKEQEYKHPVLTYKHVTDKVCDIYNGNKLIASTVEYVDLPLFWFNQSREEQGNWSIEEMERCPMCWYFKMHATCERCYPVEKEAEEQEKDCIDCMATGLSEDEYSRCWACNWTGKMPKVAEGTDTKLKNLQNIIDKQENLIKELQVFNDMLLGKPSDTLTYDKVTRFEVIDKLGRRYVIKWTKIKLSLQDDQRTLKAFVEWTGNIIELESIDINNIWYKAFTDKLTELHFTEPEMKKILKAVIDYLPHCNYSKIDLRPMNKPYIKLIETARDICHLITDSEKSSEWYKLMEKMKRLCQIFVNTRTDRNETIDECIKTIDKEDARLFEKCGKWISVASAMWLLENIKSPVK